MKLLIAHPVITLQTVGGRKVKVYLFFQLSQVPAAIARVSVMEAHSCRGGEKVLLVSVPFLLSTPALCPHT